MWKNGCDVGRVVILHVYTGTQQLRSIGALFVDVIHHSFIHSFINEDTISVHLQSHGHVYAPISSPHLFIIHWRTRVIRYDILTISKIYPSAIFLQLIVITPPLPPSEVYT